MPTLEEVISKRAPLWDSAVWEPLQRKNYKEAQLQFKQVLSDLPAADWAEVSWSGLIEGIPAFRGGLEEFEWQKYVKPLIFQTIVETMTSESLSFLFRSVDSETRETFQSGINEFIRNQAGISDTEPEEWLRKNKPHVYQYFKSNLAQELGVNI